MNKENRPAAKPQGQAGGTRGVQGQGASTRQSSPQAQSRANANIPKSINRPSQAPKAPQGRPAARAAQQQKSERREGYAPHQRQPRPNITPNATQNTTQKKTIFSPLKKKERKPEAPIRRRNEESYVFSRSLSETRERILEERRERLEDARKFQKEDVNQKLRVGAICFVASVLLISILVSVVVCSALSTDKVKKNKGEYIYNIGNSTSNVAYADSIHDDLLYISMNSIAELCEMTMSGSTSQGLRFTTKGGDWISFSPDSNEAKINGYGIRMPSPAYIKDTSCSVPLDFLKFVLSGIDVEVNYEENTITVTRQEHSDSTHLEPHYLDVSIALKTDSILFPLDENKYFEGQPLFSFKNDLSAYEPYMNPTNKQDFLMLLNKENTIDSDFEPSDLIYVDKDVPKAYWLDATAAKALEALVKEMHTEGFSDVYVTSGYRSYIYQNALYNTYIDNEMAKDPGLTYEEAEKIVQGYSAIPGQSEHHTGLCIDFMSSSMSELDETFADNEAYDWLLANAWKFGFILRYPKDKTDITRYDYEPWHWRFVGRETALEILRSGECFEEYLERTQPKEKN